MAAVSSVRYGSTRLTAAYRRSTGQRWNLIAGISYNNSLSISQYHPNRFLTIAARHSEF